MERLKHIKEALVTAVEGQLGNLCDVDTKELGEAVDMIKDMEEAMYYCSITKAMEEAEEDKELEKKLGRTHYYTPMYMDYPYERDMDRNFGRMYFSERSHPRDSQGRFIEKYYSDGNSSGGSRGNTGSGGTGNTSYFHEREFPFELRDSREGRSPMSRKMYMESKEMHKDKEHKVKELEKYMKELTEDIVEMIEDASPEEKQMLERKMTQLTSKISNLNK